MTWTVRIVNWREFQHYKDRDPPWIKLYQRKLFAKPQWRKLSGNEAKLLVDLWMLAADTRTGEITDTLEEISYKVRRTRPSVLGNLQSLEANGFISLASTLHQNASTVPRNAIPERETETEGEIERETEVENYKIGGKKRHRVEKP